MAGLYDRVVEESVDRLPEHLVVSALVGYGSGQITADGVKNSLNAWAAKHGYSALSADDETDLQKIAIEIDSKSTTTAKTNYVTGHVAVAMSTASHGVITETGWRSVLGITDTP